MNKDYLVFPGYFEKDGIRPTKDGSWKLIFNTQELNKSADDEVVSLRGKSGSVVFVEASSDTSVDDIEVPDVRPEYRGEKTPSQRLRAVLYRVWENAKSDLDFEIFYRSRMDRIIEQLKNQLD